MNSIKVILLSDEYVGRKVTYDWVDTIPGMQLYPSGERDIRIILIAPNGEVRSAELGNIKVVKQPDHILVPSGSDITKFNEPGTITPVPKKVRSDILSPGIYAYWISDNKIVVSKHYFLPPSKTLDYIDASLFRGNFYLEGTCPEDVVMVPV